MNRQIGVGDSKYVIVFDPLLTGHVIRRMRSGRVRIFNDNPVSVCVCVCFSQDRYYVETVERIYLVLLALTLF